MILERASVRVTNAPRDGYEILKNIERLARISYRSEGKMGNRANEKFLAGLLDKGHESVFEHEHITAIITCDRGVSHELVRHRLASFTQESTRYCNYSKDRFGNEITYIVPVGYLGEFFRFGKNPEQHEESSPAYRHFIRALESAEKAYFGILEDGLPLDVARAVLPTCTKTTLAMTANLREWRHILKLRCERNAHPNMQEVAKKLLKEMHETVPLIFDDLYDRWFPEKEEWDL